MAPNIYFVGPRYRHYATRSGYETIAPYCGTVLKTPVKSRYLSGQLGECRFIGDIGWRIDQATTALVQRRLYGFGILLTEFAAGFHMLRHENSLYHVLYGDTDAWLLQAFKRLSNNALVATFHEPIPRLEWLGVDKVLRFLDAALPVSEYQRTYFERFLPPDRVFVVPHGIDTDFFRPAPKLSDEPVCITVGSTLRDFETLKSAISLILASRSDVRFIAAGTNLSGGNKSTLYDDRVEIFVNLTDDALRTLYQRARIAVFSFQYATANNALLEAMACGLPVVATDVGGVSEYFGEEVGMLCPSRDPEAFATGVLAVLNDPSLAARMSRASRARALKFAYPRVAERMRRVYSEILDRNLGESAVK